MSRYYMVLRGRSARARHSSAARGLVADCSGGSRARFGFDAATYREVVSGIERAEQVQVVGFVGYSFGSVRWSYLRGRELRWAVLMRPYPLAATGRQILTARAAAVRSTRRYPAPARDSPTPTATRVLPVTRFDRLSALVELGYLPAAEFDHYARRVAAGTEPSVIGRLSDALWTRYGVDDISPAYLATLQETCAVTPGWPTSLTEVATVRDVLTAAYLPCTAMAGPTARPASPTGALCLVTSTADTVAPASLAAVVLPGGRHGTWVRSASRDHSSAEGLSRCLRAVGALPARG